jgi:hypothetical protein
MYQLFGFIGTMSFIGFILAAIRPSIFHGLKPGITRKPLLIGFGALFLLSMVVVGATEPPEQRASKPAPTRSSSPSPSKSPSTSPTPTAPSETLTITDLIGKPLRDIAARYGVQPNSAGNVVWESSTYKLLAEPKVEYVPDENGIKKAVTKDTAGFVSVGVKSLGTCKADRSILDKVDSAMRAVGLDPSKKGEQTGRGLDLGSAAYDNYPGTWKVSVSCMYDGDVPTVALSARE